MPTEQPSHQAEIEQLRAEVIRLRAALQFYADRQRWSSYIPIRADRGNLVCFQPGGFAQHGWQFAEHILNEETGPLGKIGADPLTHWQPTA